MIPKVFSVSWFLLLTGHGGMDSGVQESFGSLLRSVRETGRGRGFQGLEEPLTAVHWLVLRISGHVRLLGKRREAPHSNENESRVGEDWDGRHHLALPD